MRIIGHRPPPVNGEPSTLRAEGPAGVPSIDVGAAVAAFTGYIDAANRGKFADAARHRRELLQLGLLVQWRPRQGGRP